MLSVFLFSITISQKKWHKDEFETYQDTCSFSEKIFPLHYHRRIKSSLKCFLRGGVLLVVRLVRYQTSHLKMLAILVMIKQMILDTETCLSFESELNKAKLDRWSNQQIQVLRKM